MIKKYIFFYFKFSGFEKDPKTSKFEIEFVTPRAEFVGDYIIDGRILLIPLAGNGKCNFTYSNF